MTPKQRELARHALGLPNNNRRSYRNSFVIGSDGKDHSQWIEMVEAGEARRRDGSKLPFGGMDLFHLTRKGAETAIAPGEGLCPEDFPDPRP